MRYLFALIVIVEIIIDYLYKMQLSYDGMDMLIKTGVLVD